MQKPLNDTVRRFQVFQPAIQFMVLSNADTICSMREERTGKFRLGKDEALIGIDGKSRISIPDYAIALVDELEHSRHIRRRSRVGY